MGDGGASSDAGGCWYVGVRIWGARKDGREGDKRRSE